MKKFLLFLFAITVFFSCSKEDDESLISLEDIKTYERTFVNIYDFLDEAMSIDLLSFVGYANMLDGVTKVSIEDSIVYITTKGNANFTIDFNTYPDYEAGDLDLDNLQSYIDSINHATDNVATNGYEQTSEIFKEFIENHNLDNVDDDDNTITRASSETTDKTVKLVRRNFVIWSPYTRSDFVKEKEDIITIVGKKTKYYGKTIKFIPSSFTDLGKYDVVYFATHGSRNGYFFLPKECLYSDDIKEYENEIKAKRVENSIRKIDGKKVIGYTLKEEFFEKYLPDLSHTILYTNACHYGAEKSLFMKCAMKKHVADYFGADDICFGSHIFNAFKEFYPKLMNGSSSEKAFNSGNRSFYKNRLRGKTLESFNYKRFGSKTVYYIIPHATGVGNRITNSRATRSSDESSSIILNAQLRYASEESDDILKTIEAGICLQDMETKDVRLIPFSDKNIVYNEKKNYVDVSANNIAVSLDNLTDDKQYAYCCYTKVNNEVILSNETYKFKNEKNYRLEFKMYLNGVQTERIVDRWKERNYVETHTSNISMDVYCIYIDYVDDKYYLSTSHSLGGRDIYWEEHINKWNLEEQGELSSNRIFSSNLNADNIYATIIYNRQWTDKMGSENIKGEEYSKLEIQIDNLMSEEPHATFNYSCKDYTWRNLPGSGALRPREDEINISCSGYSISCTKRNY